LMPCLVWFRVLALDCDILKVKVPIQATVSLEKLAVFVAASRSDAKYTVDQRIRGVNSSLLTGSNHVLAQP
jgi:hypothetical protein